MKRKLPFWATLLTLIGVVILVSLGNWQLKRLEWKTGLLQKIDAAYATEAENNPLNDIDWGEGNAFTRGFLQGIYLHDKEVLIAPRTYEGRPGYHVLTPLHLSGDKGIVIVNRGWIPLDQDSPDGQWGRAIAREVVVTGMVRDVPAVNMFVPQNNIEKNDWYRIDLGQIAATRHLERLIPYIFYAESEKEADQTARPVAQKAEENRVSPLSATTSIRPNNNHRQYALFWYTMAILLVMIYALRFLRRCV